MNQKYLCIIFKIPNIHGKRRKPREKKNEQSQNNDVITYSTNNDGIIKKEKNTIIRFPCGGESTIIQNGFLMTTFIIEKQ